MIWHLFYQCNNLNRKSFVINFNIIILHKKLENMSLPNLSWVLWPCVQAARLICNNNSNMNVFSFAHKLFLQDYEPALIRSMTNSKGGHYLVWFDSGSELNQVKTKWFMNLWNKCEPNYRTEPNRFNLVQFYNLV